MAHHNDTGGLGEELAIDYLGQNQFEILYKNWRHSHWEVDIIAVKAGVLHFIEVKTRRTARFGYPEESVTKKKMQHLMNAAEAFLYEQPQWQRIQFDILAITITKNMPPDYFLIEDVYL
jgi:putative endonuclease